MAARGGIEPPTHADFQIEFFWVIWIAINFRITVNSTAAETTLEALLNSIDFTVGTEKELSMTGEIRYGLWTLSGTTLYLADDSSLIAPTSAGTVPLR